MVEQPSTTLMWLHPKFQLLFARVQDLGPVAMQGLCVGCRWRGASCNSGGVC